MEVTQHFDVSLTSSCTTTIPVMQGDGARTIIAHLTEGSQPWIVPEGVTVGLSYEIPEKNAGYYDRLSDGQPACSISGNQVSVILAPTLTEIAGPVNASIVLRDGNGSQISTFPFLLWVTKVPGMVHADNIAAPVHALDGKIYFGGPGGIVIPLELGDGIHIEQQPNGRTLLMTDNNSCNSQEVDPTVPVWARQPKKPTYTAQEVGADPAGMAQEVVDIHDNLLTAHPDIWNAVEALQDSKLDTEALPNAIQEAVFHAKARALAGKKIVYDGDSICYGAGYKGGYAQLIAEKVGGTYVNQAQGGARLATRLDGYSYHSIVDNLDNLPKDGDLYCFEGGINDYWTADIQLGTFDYTNFDGELDITTVCGALETIFRYCLNKLVGKPVCFVIVHKIQKTAYKANHTGKAFNDYREAMVGICQKYSIPFYDAFAESGLNGWNTQQSIAFLTGSSDGSPDGCHPNMEGYKRYYVPQLISLFECMMPEGVVDVEVEGTYTNWLPLSTDTDGVTVFNGSGFKANSRWSSSSNAVVEASGVYLTGNIPVASGDIVRLKNITMVEGDTSHTCKVLFSNATDSVIASLDGTTLNSNASPVWENGTLVQLTVPIGYSYIRFQAAYIGDNSIITINEPIG